MNTKKSLNVNAVILHEMNGVQYKISGKLIGINESAGTCTIRFNNNRVESNIPMSSVYINEGVLDTVKKYGSQFVDWVAKKINGFIVFIDEVGKKYFQNPINVFLAYQKEKPAGVSMYVGQNIIDYASEYGVNIKSQSYNESFSEVLQQDIETINTYWTRVMKRVGTTDESVAESVKWVNENCYRECEFSKILNETAVYTIDDLEMPTNIENYGIIRNTKALRSMIVTNISNQLALDQKIRAKRIKERTGRIIKTENENKDDYRALLIWGAPGIGKTHIIKNAIDIIFERYQDKLMLEEVNCGNLTKEGFMLPKTAGEHDEKYINVPVEWLPMYRPSTPEQDAYYEDLFARCQHKMATGTKSFSYQTSKEDNNDYTGGILFFDEVARLEGVAQNTMMGICDGSMAGLRLAKSWALIAASNRHFDDQGGSDWSKNNDTTAMQSAAYGRRWTQVTYVPTREEWLDWCRTVVNKQDSEDLGMVRVPKVITDFIESVEPGVWYDAITLGSRDDEIRAALDADSEETGEKKEFRKYKNNLKDYLSFFADIPDNLNPMKGSNQVTWNSAKWAEVGRKYRSMLKALFQFNPDGYTWDDLRQIAEENKDHDITPEILITALEKVSDIDWELFVNKEYFEDIEDSKTTVKERLSHKDGMSRLKDIQDALIYICSETFHSQRILPIKRLKEYFEWLSMFTREVCDHVYKTGYMPKEYAELDDKGKYGGFDWKKNDKAIEEVTKHLITNYPNDKGKEDFNKYLKYTIPALNNYNNIIGSLLLSNNKANKQKAIDIIVQTFNLDLSKPIDIKKLKEFFTIKTNTKTYKDKCVFNVEKISTTSQHLLYKLLSEFDFYRYILNLVKYLAKISYSNAQYREGGGFGFLGALENSDENIGRLYIDKLNLDENTYKQLINAKAAIRNEIRDSGTKMPEILEMLTIVDIFGLCKTIIRGVDRKEDADILLGIDDD